MRNNRNKDIIIFEIFSILLFLLNIFFLKINNNYFITFIIVGLVIILIKFLKVGFEKRDFRYLKDVILLVVNFSLIYTLIYYFSGLIFGYSKSGYGLRWDIIVRNVVPIIIVIISSEIFRYVLNNKIKDNKLLLLLSIIIFVLIDVNINMYLYSFSSRFNIIYLIVNCVIPSIFKNSLLTFISIKVGFKPNIIYRFITELVVFFIPIIPNLDTYIYVIMNVFFNWGLCMYLVKMYSKNKVDIVRKRRLFVISSILMSVIMVVTVYLCCGYFTYSIIAVGSGSMEPYVKVGDSVIVKRTLPSNLKVGDVLVFNKNNKKVVHRIVKIDKENESYFIKTKGDNNKDIDNFIVYNDEVIGIVRMKIKYIGYPTIWVSDLIK